MVPLTEADAKEADAVGQPKSSTQFFAIPTPKRKSQPVSEPVAPPAAAPPGPGPAQAPGMSPPGGSMAPGMGMGAGMGIQGPVAGGPASMPSQGGYPQPAMMPPDRGGGMDGNRAQSYRVFAIVAALMFMVLSALIVTVGMTVAGVYMTSNAQQVAAVPPPKPAPKSRGTLVDTGAPAPVAPAPTKKPRPSRGGGGSSKPNPKPNPGPKAPPAPPPPPANTPGAVTVTIPTSESFTSIEVKCATGFRQRGSFVNGKATVPDVPAMECDLLFKGGLPAQNKISGGQSLNCTFQGGQAVCN